MSERKIIMEVCARFCITICDLRLGRRKGPYSKARREIAVRLYNSGVNVADIADLLFINERTAYQCLHEGGAVIDWKRRAKIGL